MDYSLPESAVPLYVCVSGSKARGLNVSVSDTDYRGAYIFPLKNYWALTETPKHFKPLTGDAAFCEAHRWAEMLAKTSAEEQETLWVGDAFVLVTTPPADWLKQRREKLLCQNLCVNLLNAAYGLKISAVKKVDGVDQSKVKEGYKELADAIRRILVVNAVLDRGEFITDFTADDVDFMMFVRGENSFPVEWVNERLRLAEEKLSDAKLPVMPDASVLNGFLGMCLEFSSQL